MEKAFILFVLGPFILSTDALGSGYLGDPPPSSYEDSLPPALWFDQKLDHFRPTEFDVTWKQRYFLNDSFFNANDSNPTVFLMIGGEGPANPIWSVTGTWMEYAKIFKAMTFQLEHRFYGESHPTDDLSVKNLIYLNSEQALADLAYFIQAMNERYGWKNVRWIAFGGSYPGTLAAWLRLKYPHLVHGSVSTSGPVLAQADFKEYLEVVENVLKITDHECLPDIQQGLAQAEFLLQHRVGWKNLEKSFKLCSPLNGLNKDDVSNLFQLIVGNFEDVIQYNRDNRAFEGVKNTDVTIDTLCQIMTNGKNESLETKSSSSPYQRLSQVNDFVLKLNQQECLDHSYENTVKELKKTSWNNAIGGRQWLYQTCTEFGWYQSSDQTPDHPFTAQFPVAFMEKQCSDVFGAKYNLNLLQEGIKRTNILYGGKNLNSLTNVVFVHGSVDPWHAMGITEDLSDDATAIFIQGTAHCANMYPASPDDLPQLKDARLKIYTLIEKWLK